MCNYQRGLGNGCGGLQSGREVVQSKGSEESRADSINAPDGHVALK